MSTSYTANCRLRKPAASDRNWDAPLNANADQLDALTALGALAVSATESPSTTLNIRVSAGSYVKSDGNLATYAGTASLTLPASSTTQLWINASGSLVSGASFPAAGHVRLAAVTTNATTVVSIDDKRIQCQLAGNDLACLPVTGGTVSGSLTVATPSTSTPLMVLNATARTIGFFNATPATQATAMTNLTAGSGTASNTIADVGSSFNATTLNNNFASLSASINSLITALKRHGLMAP